MLRRVKKDVACDLPPKKETKLYVGLTDMQQTWYTKILQKDAHELNALGGPDRVRLLNILMQLRKCCNHPYLFDGAESGPPYTDGPHIWENSGKMQLMHKLLPKLKENGSRVLIFSQMTRVLDILEDYCRLVGYEYCRLDGNTDGERRDAQMDEFNSEHSPKFCFLLSTRAGGLGINLATADVVILYDSDWNPQVDLQAQDRAHRIGQKKPVHVFRFVTEGTVEEKIIERADRKLFLDAAVIQQGRLAEQHASLEKEEIMKMVRFGADQILNCKGGTYTDEDIDALIARGEERTIAMQAKLQTDVKHNLANFTLLADDEIVIDTFSFGGKNYREDSKKNFGNFITLPQRERKRNYDVNEYFRDMQGNFNAKPTVESAKKKIKKGPATHDFQLFDQQRLKELAEREASLVVKRNDVISQIKLLRDKSKTPPTGESENSIEIMALIEQMEAELSQYQLSNEEQEEYQRLQEEGFPDWSRKDYKCFILSLERYGRYNLPAILKEMADECGKSHVDVKMYYVQFWLHYTRIIDHEKVIEKITKGEQKIDRLRKIRDAIQEKVERHLEDVYGSFFWDASHGQEHMKLIPSVAELLQYSWPKMKVNYGSTGKGRCYQEEEDAFLICMMHRHGYGAAERIRMEIRRAWQFRLDWYFKSRSTAEIQKRCDLLVRLIEKENSDFIKKEGLPKVDEKESTSLKAENED
jgi:SWI/SNF-related matrix-associated actin-dependent regulator of chromatin subfamily A member 5